MIQIRYKFLKNIYSLPNIGFEVQLRNLKLLIFLFMTNNLTVVKKEKSSTKY